MQISDLGLPWGAAKVKSPLKLNWTRYHDEERWKQFGLNVTQDNKSAEGEKIGTVMRVNFFRPPERRDEYLGTEWHKDMSLLTIVPKGNTGGLAAKTLDGVKFDVEEHIDPNWDLLIFAG